MQFLTRAPARRRWLTVALAVCVSFLFVAPAGAATASVMSVTVRIGPTGNPVAGDVVFDFVVTDSASQNGMVGISDTTSQRSSIGWLNNGIGYVTVPMTAGVHDVEAYYQNAQFQTVESKMLHITVDRAPIGLQATPSPAAFASQPLPFNTRMTAQITNIFPTGATTFTWDGAPIVKDPNFGTVTVPAAKATAGTHTATVSFEGDANFLPESVTYTQVINKYTVQFPGDFSCPPSPGTAAYPLCIAPTPAGPLHRSLDLTAYGVTNVSSGSNISAPTPVTGTARWEVAGMSGEVPVAGSRIDFTTPPIAPGVYTLKVTYLGNDTFNTGGNSYMLRVVDNAPVTPAATASTSTSSDEEYQEGYHLVADDGGIFAYGDAPFLGSTGGMKLNKPIIGMAPTWTVEGGYWLVASDGGVFAFGDAKFYGSTGGMTLNQPIVGVASTPTGEGYWLVAKDGGIFAFGDAKFYGSTGAMKLNSPIVSMTPSATGKGYWLVAADGGIFAFGDAKFYGSAGSLKLNSPIVSMASTWDGTGYWLVAADGGIFAYGSAEFHGSTGAIKLNKPIVGMTPNWSGNGYWLVASDGGIFAFGDAKFYGSAGGLKLNRPIVGMSIW